MAWYEHLCGSMALLTCAGYGLLVLKAMRNFTNALKREAELREQEGDYRFCEGHYLAPYGVM